MSAQVVAAPTDHQPTVIDARSASDDTEQHSRLLRAMESQELQVYRRFVRQLWQGKRAARR